ncbi:type IV secretion protein Rhs [Pilimelia terevasa]|uniref:Type IV secretion protein Rhs n=1 Tax=Pilimelia terevasa TaxID=53372 RepID=A0A8J3FG65_9ACTN|nr:VgrG-related protein [Pilimelia terevasa]GGK23332.1 type IV secretion protein Rhs [Pilimelia terevasa]
MPNQGFTSSLEVTVDGVPPPADVWGLLVSAYVDDSRNLPDLFALRFRDPGRTVLAKGRFAIGSAVRLTARASDDRAGPQVLLDGEITALEAELDAEGSVTVVRGLDRGHRLFRGRRVAAYENMSVADIVRRVARRAGLPVGHVDDAPGVAGAPQTEVTQENLSDWDFLHRLADTAGAEINVVAGRLEFRVPRAPRSAPGSGTQASTSPLVLEAGANLLSLRAGVTAAAQVPRVEVRGWDPEHKRAVVAVAPAQAPSTEIRTDPAALAALFASPPLVATDVPYRGTRAAQTAADALAAQVAGAFAELDGTARGNPALRAGTAVRLSGMGAEFDGRYTLSATRHTFDAAGYTTAFVVSGRQERSLYGLVSHGGAVTAAPRVAGLVTAVVSDVRDPAQQGRVRLKLPWLAEDYVTGWARTVQAGAGPGRGTLLLPEVGDEVLVGFEQGRVDAPYVLGGLYNGKDLPPSTAAPVVDGGNGQVTGRYLVSRTGHRVDLAESTAVDGVTVATGDGRYKLVLDRKGTTVTVAADGTVTITGSRGVTVDAGTGDLTLQGNKVVVRAQTDVSVDAGGRLSLAGTAGAALEGAAVKVAGQSQTEVSAAGPVTVRGAIVRIN